MRKVIIHISDLHVTSFKTLSGEVLDSVNSWLNTNPSDEIFNNYIDEFCSHILKHVLIDRTFYLIVTGDITNQGLKEEFDCVSTFFNKVIKRLDIDKKNIIIVPGDHDVNRFDCQAAYLADDCSKRPFEYHEEKLKKFSSFYNDFFSEKFDASMSILRCIEWENERVVLVGLNSIFKIGFEGPNLGFFDIDKLDSELMKVEEKYNGFSKIAILHHNLESQYEDSAIGKFEQNNRISTIKLLEKFNFKIILNGNEHTRSTSNSIGEISVSDSGSFGSKSPDPSFKIYELVDDPERLFLENKPSVLMSSGKIRKEMSFGAWVQIEAKRLLEENVFIINQKLGNIENTIELPTTIIGNLEIEESKQVEIDLLEELSTKTYSNSFYKDELLKIVKEKKLYYSGHFHWSENSRAHNWIDIGKILNNFSDLQLCKDSIIDVIKECDLEDKFDLIIGLGIEGNILSTKVSVKFNKPYTFLPYSYRYDEHNSFEKELNFTNNGQFKNVLIISDVVHDGRTLRKLINKRESEFFAQVEKIIVISLFYTGDNSIGGSSLLNVQKLNSESENIDHIEHRIEYYHVLNMRVEECPYKFNSDFRNECLVVREGLDCVHKFYDEEKAIIKRKLKILKK